MKSIFPAAVILLLTCPYAVAGPYSPAAGQTGSTAIARTDPRFTTWATRVISYQPGTSLGASWQDTAKSLGPATDDPTHITGLGSGGTITLAFPGFIHNGPGPDFAVFENSFSDTFLEFAWVEVSQDGVKFVRFPNASLTENPVEAFGSIDPTNLDGLAGKYRQPFGVPFDLEEVGLASVSHVRLVDVVGDGTARDTENRVIYDPWPVTGSAGFDLDAIGVIHLKQWQVQPAGTLNGDGVNAAAFAHLPDGRFVLGLQGQLSVQTAWGHPELTAINGGGLEFDPSFIAVANAETALLGAGGGFGATSGLHGFNPSIPALPLTATPLATLTNYGGIWWISPVSGRSGWIIAGIQPGNNRHGLHFVSADGLLTGTIVENLSTFSAGVATDAAGNVFAAQYELPGSPTETESEWVRKFSAAQIDSAIAAMADGQPVLSGSDGTRVFQFDSASSLAIDSLGRLWTSGFKTTHLQIFDPATGASLRLTPDHAPSPGVSDPLYQIQTFTRHGEGWVGFLMAEETGTPGTPVLHGVAPVDAIRVFESLESWQAFHFGAANLTPESEATEWGIAADPDGDGQSNLLEYAFNTPPLEASISPLQPGRTSGRLTLTFPRHPLRPDVTLTIEAATDPSQTWTELAISTDGQPFTGLPPANPLILETAGSPVHTVIFRDVAGGSANPRRFLRIRIRPAP